MANRMTSKRKREIEARITAISDELFALGKETGMMISVAAYSSDKEAPCIFIHDEARKCLFSIDERGEIDGFFSSKRFTRPSGLDKRG